MLGPLSQQKLGNKYLLGELLGQGGFGSVYKAQNLYLNRLQAIKILLEHHFVDSAFRARFIREAQVLAGLNHPNILPIYDFEIEDRIAYLVMPFISGGTLQTILKQRGALSLDVTEAYLRQICAALQYAHTRNIVHLDLKPLNLLHQDGTLLLSDFGLAHLMKEGAIEGGTSLNFGSPHYMAPEHLRGEPQQRSDIYALGVILYQMLTGQIPFHGTTPEAVMIKHLTEAPPPLHTVRPDLPVALDGVLNRALAKKPEERYATAGNLFDDFKQAVAHRSYGAADPPPPPPRLEPTVPAGIYAEISPPPGQNFQAMAAGVPPTQSGSASRAAMPRRGAILTSAFLIQLAFFGGFSTFLSSALIRTLYLTSTILVSISFVATLGMGIAAGLGGYLQNRSGPRKIATIAGILYGLGALVLAFAPGIIFVFPAALLIGIGEGLAYIVTLTVVLQWFPERRGIASGLVLAGSALGSVVTSLFLPVFGIRLILLILGVGGGLIAIVAAQGLRAIPEGDGSLLAYGKPQQPVQARREYSLREALGNPVWYMLLIMLIFAVVIGNSQVFTERALLLSVNAIVIASLIGKIAQVVGCFSGGWISDLIGRPSVLAILFSISMVGCVLYLLHVIPAVFIVALIAFCAGGCLSVLPALSADGFGARNIGTVYGTMLLIAFILGNLAPASLITVTGIESVAGVALVGTVLAIGVSLLKARSLQK